MALLFADQLHDEPAGRVWARTVVDLVITIPTRHLEAHMKRTPSPTLPLSITALSTAAVVVAVVGGTNRWVLTIGLPVAVLSALLAAILWHDARPISVTRDTTARGWKFLASGIGLLVALIVATTATGELPDGMWFPAMAAFLFAIILTATGVVLTLVHIVAGRRKSLPS
jgi:energy-converting hydrogenase Eha subunit A